MIRTNLCDYIDAYILVKGTVSVPNMAAQCAAVNKTNKEVTFKNWTPFTSCITEIKNTQVENAEYIVIVMSMYNLIEYIDVYLKISGSLWQYCRVEPALDNNGNIIGLPANNNKVSCKYKQQITRKTGNGCKKSWKNGSIKISKSLLEDTWNVFN